MPSPTLSVNVTSKQLHDPEFGARLGVLIGETGLGGSQIRLEVPESVVMKNVEGAIGAMAPSSRSACGWRSTISAPATPASPRCAVSRSIPSSSTASS